MSQTGFNLAHEEDRREVILLDLNKSLLIWTTFGNLCFYVAKLSELLSSVSAKLSCSDELTICIP